MLAKRLIPAAFAALFVGALVFATRAPASGTAAPFDGEPEIIAATFASAWCPACRVLEPKLAKVIPEFSSEPVSFVEFDFTFGPRDELKQAAEAYRIGEIYERNKGATGFTILVDYDTGEILDTLTMNFSEAAMKAAIARAIVIAASTDELNADEAEIAD
ncbi:MAG: hypothetical protein R3C58_10005 [Parvularculaceae bacterium]